MAAHPQGTNAGCPFCKGTGACHKCNGKAYLSAPGTWLRPNRVVVCNACLGSGKCQLCRGQDAQKSESRNA